MNNPEIKSPDINDTRPKQTTFQELLEKFNSLHTKKDQDYSGDRGTYFNFEYAARMIEPMVKESYDSIHVVFMTMYGIKLAREITLLEAGKIPNNEGIVDTMDDLSVYTIIHNACMRDHLKKVGQETAQERIQELTNAMTVTTDKNSIEEFLADYNPLDAHPSEKK